jgi:cellulose synthase/poly-beta-1,6-N-acetylglucosamine synthase-like glycosyltransferase
MKTIDRALPFVSVIVPVYNDQAGVERCLDGLATQTYPAERFEVLIVDNRSSPPIHFDGAVPGDARLLFCDKVGSYAARNLGIIQSRGEICGFTDADCIPQPDWIEQGVSALIQNGQKCIVGGDVRFRSPETGDATELYQYLSGFPQRTNITERGFAATANLFSYRDHFDRAGMFDTNLLSGGDLEWCLRAAQHGINVVFCNTAIVTTSPRADLPAAIRQARRVAGGRFFLRHSALSTLAPDRLRPHREPLAAIGWIFGHRELSILARLRLLFVASVIKGAQVAEVLRLKLGGKPERR